MPHQVLTREIETWLLEQTLWSPDIEEMFETVCVRIRAAGIPLDRAALSWPTLHPLFNSEQIFWRHQEGSTLEQYPHAAGVTDAFLRSPFNHVLIHDLDRMRRELTGPNALLDFDVLIELRDKGFTDYLLTTTRMRIANTDGFRGGPAGILASWATKRENGFSDDDIIVLSRIQRVFAVACHSAIQRRIMEALSATFLGRTAGERVLSGNTRLGDGKSIRAVVWFSDLRASTWLSGVMEPESYLHYLSEYYSCTAEPVIENGGEIIDFIGDAVLAIFPVKGDLGGPEAARAARRAMEAALDRLQAYRERPGAAEMQFSITLALGEIMFGNIGVPTRLSFSAIGRVVNTVTRIDALSKQLGRSVLATAELAACEPDEWCSLGAFTLEDIDVPVEVFARACARDQFDNSELRRRLREKLAG